MTVKLRELMSVALAATKSGTYLWNIPANAVLVDIDAAAFFGFSPGCAGSGLPIELFLERIHPADRARVARSLHEGIHVGKPHQEFYRVIHSDGSIHHLFARGQCFFGPDGVATDFAGVIFDMTLYDDEGLSLTIADLCDAAHACARQSEDIGTSQFLEEVSNHLHSDYVLRKRTRH